MKQQSRSVLGLAMAIGILCPALAIARQSGPETFTATASVKSPTASGAVKVTFRIDRFVTDAERDRMMAVVKSKDAAATRKALNAAADIGYIEIGKQRTPIKYAYARATGDGRLLTVVTARPVLFVGAAQPGAKSKEGFDLALALLILDGQGRGDGELAPAARVKVDDKGAIVTDDYAHETVRLTGIERVK